MKHATLLWIDLETTGLSPFNHQLLEVAAIATGDDLVELGRFHGIVDTAVKKPANTCDKAALEMHIRSGLWNESITSGSDIAAVDKGLSDFIHHYRYRDLTDAEESRLTPDERKARLVNMAGNSVWFDASFVERQLPLSKQHFHHRVLDVTSLHECARRWWPEAYCRPAAVPHRAMADIESSLACARRYRAEMKPFATNTDGAVGATLTKGLTLEPAMPPIPSDAMSGLVSLVVIPASSLSKPLRTPAVAAALEWIRTTLVPKQAPALAVVTNESEAKP
jgi:oligoribonuclease